MREIFPGKMQVSGETGEKRELGFEELEVFVVRASVEKWKRMKN